MSDKEKIEQMLDHVRKEKKRLMQNAYSLGIGNSVGEILKKLEKIVDGG